MRRKIKVSILFVYYKEKKELFSCLNSIKRSKIRFSYEIIVVDNSDTNLLEKKLDQKYPKVIYVKAPSNLGFGKGINLAARYATGEYLFILNPDTKILPNTLETLVDFANKKKGRVAVAPMLFDEKLTKVPRLGSKELTPIRAIFALSIINKIYPNNPISKSYRLETGEQKSFYKADILPGIFLIKKSIFQEIGGFDENFFLYFEDTDFFVRLKKKKYQAFILQDSKIIHIGSVATSRQVRTSKVVAQSRFYYFKKHYGLISALIVEMFDRFSKWHVALIVITLIGALLRLFMIEENFIFLGELGYDYMTIKNFILDGKVPLLGPPTSHAWFAIGPLFYWIFSVILPLGDYHPIVGEYFWVSMGTSAIVLSYFVVREFFGPRTGLITSYLVAISPAWIRLTRGARFNFVVAVLFFPLFYFLTKNLQEKGKYLFWTGFFLGLSSHFFGGYIVLIGAVGLPLFLRRKDFNKKQIKKGLIGFFIPFIPFLVHNVFNKFEMLIKITLWIPYRVLGFFGLYPKNTADADVIRANFASFYNFFIESWFPENSIYAFILFLVVLIFIFVKTKKSLKWESQNIAWLILMILLVVSYLGIFVHGDPPPHYYLIIYPIPIIFLSILLSKILVNRIGKIVVLLVLFLTTLINFRFFFSEKWFYIPREEFVLEKVLVPYRIQEEIVQLIYEDAEGKMFELARVGPYDQFEADYALNYHYLLWRLGNEPVDEANLKYTIYEDTSTLAKDSEKELFWVGNIAILKEENEI